MTAAPTFAAVKELSKAPWPYWPISVPVFYSMGIYATAGLVEIVDRWVAAVPFWCAAFFPLLLMFIAFTYAAFKLSDKKTLLFVAGVAASSAAWLIWACVTRPYSLISSATALLLLLGVGPTYGITRRRIQRQLEKAREEEEQAITEALEKPVDEWEQIFTLAGFPGVTVIDKPKHRAGYTVKAKLPLKSRFTWSTIAASTESLEATANGILDADIRHGALTVCPGRLADDVEVIVDTEDILSEYIPYDMTDCGNQTISEQKFFGLFKSGEPMEWDLTSGHGFVVAAPGGGKSNFGNNLIARTTECSDAIMWVSAVDKGMSLMAPWLKPWLEASIADRKRPVIYPATTEQESVNQLLMFYRLTEVRQYSPRGGEDKVKPSHRRPQLIYLIEEAPTLMSSTNTYQTHIEGEMLTPGELVLRCGRLSRSEAGRIWLISQRGTVTFLGPNGGDVKSLFDFKVGMRTNGTVDTLAIFDRLPQGIDLTKLEHPGSVLVEKAGTPTMLGRNPHLDPVVNIPVLADRHSQWVPEFEPALLKAWGKLYSERFSPERFGDVERKLRNFLRKEEEGFTDDFDLDLATAEDYGQKKEALMETPNGQPPAQLAAPPLPAEWSDILEAQQLQDELSNRGQDVPELTDKSWLNELDNIFDDASAKVSQATGEQVMPRRLEMRRFIDDAGPEGAALADIVEKIDQVHAATVRRWLAKDVEDGILTQPSHGRYASRQ